MEWYVDTTILSVHVFAGGQAVKIILQELVVQCDIRSLGVSKV